MNKIRNRAKPNVKRPVLILAVILLSLTLLQLVMAILVYNPKNCDTVFEYSVSMNVFTYLIESQLVCLVEIVLGCLFLDIAIKNE